MERAGSLAKAVVVTLMLAACGSGPDGTESPEPLSPLEPGGGGGGGNGEGDNGDGDVGTIPPRPGDPNDGNPGNNLPPGPWPTDDVLDYSARFGIDTIQSAGVDDDYNVWVLSRERIGVIRPGTSAVQWTSNVGQAAEGFSADGRAINSTVLCGGGKGQAYVGYLAPDLTQPYREAADDFEFQRGDMDAVRVQDDGSIVLEAHLGESVEGGPTDIGIRNSNDWHYDEDRTVLTCVKKMTGRGKGDVYIGTNHGVTVIRGLRYNSHRHPSWQDDGSLRIGYNYALGFSQSGDLLIGNEWKLGMIFPPENIELFTDETEAPFDLNTHAAEVNGLKDMDYWRGFTQTREGFYYVASARYGLWLMDQATVGTAQFKKLSGLPTEKLTSLQATLDGLLFIGTEDQGLWQRDERGVMTKVAGVGGSNIRQLVYDPTVSPAMLMVVSDNKLYVLRGH